MYLVCFVGIGRFILRLGARRFDIKTSREICRSHQLTNPIILDIDSKGSKTGQKSWNKRIHFISKFLYRPSIWLLQQF